MVFPRLSIFLAALVLLGTGGLAAQAAPALSSKLHHEPLAAAVDPVTARGSKPVSPTQEGGLRRIPANHDTGGGASSVLFSWQPTPCSGCVGGWV